MRRIKYIQIPRDRLEDVTNISEANEVLKKYLIDPSRPYELDDRESPDYCVVRQDERDLLDYPVAE